MSTTERKQPFNQSTNVIIRIGFVVLAYIYSTYRVYRDHQTVLALLEEPYGEDAPFPEDDRTDEEKTEIIGSFSSLSIFLVIS